jgi:UDP-glucose 4-epimerase
MGIPHDSNRSDFALAAARDEKSVSVFGDDYDTTDGTCIRERSRIDIAETHVLALEYPLRGGANCSVNLANGRGYSVKEGIAMAERVSGRRIRLNITLRRVGDPAALIGAFNRAQATLGWAPARSDLQIQIRDAWNWMRGAVRPAKTQ